MERRPLGRTGLSLPVIGFGCAPLGGEYGALDEAEGRRAVLHALERGIDFFDVAPYYGRTLAEERLGRALEGRRDEVVLATKCCRFDRRGFDFSAERVRADIDASLRRLRTDRVDLFQVHDVEFARREQLLEETLPAMRAAQATGKARFVGVTGLSLPMLRDLVRAAELDAVLSYCHYDLMADDLERVLRPAADERGVGLINASSLHMGILSERGPQGWHPAPEEVKAAGLEVAARCRARGRSVAAVALRFALDYDGVASTLVGMRSAREVDLNLAVLEARSDLELLDEIARLVAPVKDRTWHEGLPENAP